MYFKRQRRIVLRWISPHRGASRYDKSERLVAAAIVSLLRAEPWEDILTLVKQATRGKAHGVEPARSQPTELHNYLVASYIDHGIDGRESNDGRRLFGPVGARGPELRPRSLGEDHRLTEEELQRLLCAAVCSSSRQAQEQLWNHNVSFVGCKTIRVNVLVRR
jgi:hypothetical protein